MPVERPGDPGLAASKVADPSSTAPSEPDARPARGPKRTPRPDSGNGLAATRVTGGDASSDSNGARADRTRADAPRSRTSPATADGPPARTVSASTTSPAASTGVTQETEQHRVAGLPWGSDTSAYSIPTFSPAAAQRMSVPAQVPVPTAHPRPAGERERRGRRGRRVNRVVRRIELWSVLKLSLVLYTCLYLAVLGTLAVVWGLAYSSGQVENLQKFLADVGLENYRFYGDQMFRACAAIGAVGVLAGTVITVLTASLINIVSEITGGIRLIVIEEEPVARR